MKRIFIVAMILLSTVSAGFVNDFMVDDTIRPLNDTTRPYATKFGENWFISANGTVNWWQGSDRIPAGNFDKPVGPTFGAYSTNKMMQKYFHLQVKKNPN